MGRIPPGLLIVAMVIACLLNRERPAVMIGIILVGLPFYLWLAVLNARSSRQKSSDYGSDTGWSQFDGDEWTHHHHGQSGESHDSGSHGGSDGGHH